MIERMTGIDTAILAQAERIKVALKGVDRKIEALRSECSLDRMMASPQQAKAE